MSPDGTGFHETDVHCQTGPIVIGEKDPLGETVDRILLMADDFVIYESGDKVRYFINSRGDKVKAEEMHKRVYPFIDEICMIEDIVCGMQPVCALGSERNKYNQFKTRTYDIIAKIMGSCLHGEKETAENLVRKITSAVTMRRDSQNRMRYIYANSFGFLIFLTAAISFHFLPVLNGLKIHQDVQAINVIIMGILGAFFSVAVGVNKVRVKHSITVGEMIYTGFIRIPIGIIAAIVVIFLIEGGWILGSLDEQAKTWSLYLFGFLAGFSELFIPNALKQVENGATGQTRNPIPASTAPTAPPGQLAKP